MTQVGNAKVSITAETAQAQAEVRRLVTQTKAALAPLTKLTPQLDTRKAQAEITRLKDQATSALGSLTIRPKVKTAELVRDIKAAVGSQPTELTLKVKPVTQAQIDRALSGLESKREVTLTFKPKTSELLRDVKAALASQQVELGLKVKPVSQSQIDKALSGLATKKEVSIDFKVKTSQALSEARAAFAGKKIEVGLEIKPVTQGQLDKALSGLKAKKEISFDLRGNAKEKLAELKTQLQDLKSAGAQAITVNVGAVSSLITRLAAQITDLRAIETRLASASRGLGGQGSGAGGGGPGGGPRPASSGVSASNAALLSQLAEINNAYKRGDVSADFYGRRLAQLQTQLRYAADRASAGSREFNVLDRALTQTAQSAARLAQSAAGGAGVNSLTAGTKALLAELDKANNAYKRGDLSAADYSQKLTQLQTQLRAAAAGAAAGSRDFSALDRAVTNTANGLSRVKSDAIVKIRTDLAGARQAFDAAAAGATNLAQRRAAVAAYERDLAAIRQRLQQIGTAGQLSASQLGAVNRMLAQTAREGNTIRGGINIAGLSGNVLNALRGLPAVLGSVGGPLGAAAGSAAGLAGGLGQVAKAAGPVGIAVAAAAVAIGALAVALKSSIDTAAQYEQTLGDIKALTQPTAEAFTKLKAATFDIGKPLGVGARDAASAVLELNKAGLSTADTLNGGLRGALQLAGAAGLGTAEAATIASSAMTAFGLSGKDLPAIADRFANFANKTFLGAADLSQAIAAVGPVARSSGIDLAQFSGIMATLAQGGFKTMSDAGTSLKTMLLSLQSPTTDGAKYLRAMGVNVFDAQGKMKPFNQTIGDLREKLVKLTPEAQKKVMKEIFGQDAIRAAEILLRVGPKAIDANTAAMKKQGEAARVAKERLNTLQGASKQFGATMEEVRIRLGTGFLEPLTGIVRGATSTVQSLLNMSKGAGATGLAFRQMGQNSQQALQSLASIARVVFGAIAAVYNAVLRPVLSVLGSVWSVLSAAAVTALTILGNVVAGVFRAISGIFTGFVSAFTGGGNTVKLNLGSMAAKFSQWAEVARAYLVAVGKVAGELPKAFGEMGRSIGLILAGVSKVFSGFALVVFDYLYKPVEPVLKLVSGAFVSVSMTIGNSIVSLVKWVGERLSPLIHILEKMGVGIATMLGKALSGVADGVKGLIGGVADEAEARAQAEAATAAENGAKRTSQGLSLIKDGVSDVNSGVKGLKGSVTDFGANASQVFGAVPGQLRAARQEAEQLRKELSTPLPSPKVTDAVAKGGLLPSGKTTLAQVEAAAEASKPKKGRATASVGDINALEAYRQKLKGLNIEQLKAQVSLQTRLKDTARLRLAIAALNSATSQQASVTRRAAAEDQRAAQSRAALVTRMRQSIQDFDLLARQGRVTMQSRLNFSQQFERYAADAARLPASQRAGLQALFDQAKALAANTQAQVKLNESRRAASGPAAAQARAEATQARAREQLVTGLRRQIQDFRALAEAGKVTEARQVAFNRVLEDAATKANRLPPALRAGIQGLLDQGAALRDSTNGQAAYNKAKASGQVADAASTRAREQLVTGLRRQIQDFRALADAGKVTEARQVAFNRVLEDAATKANRLPPALRAGIQGLLDQGAALRDSTNGQVAYNKAKASGQVADAASTRAREQLVTGIRRQIQDFRALAEAGKVTEARQLAFNRALEDAATKANRLPASLQNGIQGLLDQGAALRDSTNGQVAYNKAKAQGLTADSAAGKARAELVRQTRQALASLKLLNDSGKVTEKQALSQRQKFEDLAAAANRLPEAQRTGLQALFDEAGALLAVADQQVKVNKLKAQAVELEKQRKAAASLTTELGNMSATFNLKISEGTVTPEALLSYQQRLEALAEKVKALPPALREQAQASLDAAAALIPLGQGVIDYRAEIEALKQAVGGMTFEELTSALEAVRAADSDPQKLEILQKEIDKRKTLSAETLRQAEAEGALAQARATLQNTEGAYDLDISKAEGNLALLYAAEVKWGQKIQDQRDAVARADGVSNEAQIRAKFARLFALEGISAEDRARLDAALTAELTANSDAVAAAVAANATRRVEAERKAKEAISAELLKVDRSTRATLLQQGIAALRRNTEELEAQLADELAAEDLTATQKLQIRLRLGPQIIAAKKQELAAQAALEEQAENDRYGDAVEAATKAGTIELVIARTGLTVRQTLEKEHNALLTGIRNGAADAARDYEIGVKRETGRAIMAADKEVSAARLQDAKDRIDKELEGLDQMNEAQRQGAVKLFNDLIGIYKAMLGPQLSEAAVKALEDAIKRVQGKSAEAVSDLSKLVVTDPAGLKGRAAQDLSAVGKPEDRDAAIASAKAAYDSLIDGYVKKIADLQAAIDTFKGVPADKLTPDQTTLLAGLNSSLQLFEGFKAAAEQAAGQAGSRAGAAFSAAMADKTQEGKDALLEAEHELAGLEGRNDSASYLAGLNASLAYWRARKLGLTEGTAEYLAALKKVSELEGKIIAENADRNPFGGMKSSFKAGQMEGPKQFNASLQSMAKGMGNMLSPMAIFASILEKINPAGMILEGMFSVLEEPIKALQEPFKIIGTLLGSVIAPILELLAPILQFVAELFTMLYDALASFIKTITFGLVNIDRRTPASEKGSDSKPKGSDDLIKLKNQNDLDQLDLDYKKGLLSRAAYEEGKLKLVEERIENERLAEQAALETEGKTAEQVAAQRLEIDRKYALQLEKEKRDMLQASTQQSREDAQALADAELAELENLLAKKLISQKDYEERKLALAIAGLERQRRADIEAAEGNEQRILAINRKYDALIEKEKLDMAARLSEAFTAIGNTLAGSITGGARDGLLNALKQGNFGVFRQSMAKNLKSAMFEAVLDAAIESAGFKALLQPAIDSLTAAFQSGSSSDIDRAIQGVLTAGNRLVSKSREIYKALRPLRDAWNITGNEASQTQTIEVVGNVSAPTMRVSLDMLAYLADSIKQVLPSLRDVLTAHTTALAEHTAALKTSSSSPAAQAQAPAAAPFVLAPVAPAQKAAAGFFERVKEALGLNARLTQTPAPLPVFADKRVSSQLGIMSPESASQELQATVRQMGQIVDRWGTYSDRHAQAMQKHAEALSSAPSTGFTSKR